VSRSVSGTRSRAASLAHAPEGEAGSRG
jgi:hypothetical protein